MNFLPIEVRKEAEKMHLKGFKQNQIAKKLGVTEKTVTRWLLPLKKEYPANHLKINRALKLFGYGHSKKAIAKKIKVTEKTVAKWINNKN
jgi:transposase